MPRAQFEWHVVSYITSMYDDAVSVNTSAHGDGIRRALASVGVIKQRAPTPLAAHHYNDLSATAHCKAYSSLFNG